MIKYGKIVLAMVLFSLLFTACDETDYADVQFTTEYTIDLNAETDSLPDSAKQMNSYFSVFDSINPMENENFSEYADKIKEVYIQEFFGRVTSINTTAKLKNAQILISTDTNLAIWSLSNEVLMEGTILELKNFEGQYEELIEILHEHQTFDVSMQGETVEENVKFIIELNLLADITAEPL